MDIYIPKFPSQNNRPIVIYNITTKVDDDESFSFIGSCIALALLQGFKINFLTQDVKNQMVNFQFIRALINFDTFQLTKG
jgi:hypothetical protein